MSQHINDAELCAWLRENSSGAYRNAALAADRIEELLARRPDSSKVAEPIGFVVRHDAKGGNFFTGIESFEHMKRVYGDAVMAVCAAPAAQENCTCPSGDGSLRHPCPEHPPEVAKVHAMDEEAEFRRAFPPISLELSAPIYDEREKERGLKYIGWMKRAALAAPAADSAEHGVTVPEQAGYQQTILEKTVLDEVKHRLRGMISNGDIYQQGYKWVQEMIGIVEGAMQPAERAAEPSATKLTRYDAFGDPHPQGPMYLVKDVGALLAAAPASTDVGELPDMRTQFEEWARTEFDPYDVAFSHAQGDYPSMLVASAWAAWKAKDAIQASSAALPKDEDGERWRWVRDYGLKHAWCELTSDGDGMPFTDFRITFSIPEFTGIGPDDTELRDWTPEELDKAIDSARAALSATAEKGEAL